MVSIIAESTTDRWPPPAPLQCHICRAQAESATVETGLVSSNVRAFSSEKFQVWRCGACQSIHACDEVNLDYYYERYPFFDLPVDWRTRAIYAAFLRRLQTAGVQRSDRILDYGCGSGALVRFLVDQGYSKAIGYDSYNPLFSDRDVLQGRYECVVAQDVIEHVADPLQLLGLFDELVQPGGVVAIGTPNASALDLSRAEAYRHTLHAPYHRHIFSTAALVAAGEARRWSLARYYPTQYANTRVPFLNSRFYLFVMRTLDDTLDCLLEPPRIAPLLARLPETLFWGMCGAGFAEETDVMALFRKETVKSLTSG